MPFTPDVAKRTAASTDAIDFLDNMHDYVSNTSTNWAVDNSNTTGGGKVDAMTISPTSGSYSFQLNFRLQNNNEVTNLIDPDSSITDPGDGSTAPTTGANASPEDRVFVDDNGDIISTYYVVDAPDMFSFLTVNPDQDGTSFVSQTGIVYHPKLQNLGSGYGRLGFRVPGSGFGFSQDYWFEDTAVSSTVDRSILEFKLGDWRLAAGRMAQYNNFDGSGILPNFTNLTIPMSGGQRELGFTKYICNTSGSYAPGTILEGSNGTDWVIVGGPGGTSGFGVIWDASITPIFAS
jgi:hypothetical protein